MSGNYAVNVPKLKGRENYDDWAFAVENFMILEGVDVNRATELTVAENKKARAKIIMTIDPSLFVHIKTEATVQALWSKLKSLFDDSGFTRNITLLRNLISIRLESCDCMTSYVNQLVETAQRLKGTGFEINDEWIGSLLLAGLPERFSPMIMAIEHSGLKISADAIKTKLLDMSSDFEVKSEGALIAHAQKRHTKARVQNSNGGSRNETHTSSVIGFGNINTTQKKQIRCYHCKKVGHFKSQCHLLNKDKQKQTSNVLSAVFLAREFNQNDWYVDSGASAHMVSNKNILTNLSYEPKVKEIMVADRTKVPVLCSGNLRLTTRVNTVTHEVEIKNVLCIPTLTTNLLSVSKMIANGNRVSFNKNGCYIYNAQNVCIGEASLENDVYRLNIEKSEQILAATAQTSCNTWHRRLGHINMNDLEKMKKGAVKGVTYQEKQEVSKSSCVVCCEGKQTRLPFSASTSKSSRVLEVVHTDLCGPMEKKSLGLARYYLLFVDDYSRMCFVYFLKEKNEAFKYFREFKEQVENQQSQKIKVLRSDNGGEFCSMEMENYLKRHGIIHQKTVAYTPEQNGLSERYNRSIVEKARCLLYDASFDKQLWAEAVNTAVYLKNRSPAAVLGNNTTPYEMWTGRKPDLSHIRVFGSPAMVHIPKVRRNKWDKKSKMLQLVGYSENTKGYRLYDQNSHKIIVARDVMVMESLKNDTTEIIVEEREPDKAIENNTIVEGENQSISMDDPTYVASDSSSDQDDDFSECLTADDQIVATQRDILIQQGKRVRRAPERYAFSNMCVEELTSEPISLEDALSGPEKDQWCSAIEEELKSFRDNDTWELVDRPSAGTVVKNKWVFKKKCDSSGSVRYRARLVAKGFTQVKGLNKWLEMLNLSPSSYRNVDDDDEVRVVNSKKIYSRRPWYAPAIDPIEILADPGDQYNSGYETDYNAEPNEYYEKVEVPVPVTSTQLEAIGQVPSSPPSPRYYQAPTYRTVSESSIANGFNLREAALVALGGASAALVLLIIMAGVFVARRRKNSPSPTPSPPILVYPPHDVTAPCYLTKEVNFSLPALRSSSLGELRDVSVSSLPSDVLCPPTPTQYRSNSFTNTTDLGVLDPSLYKADILVEDQLWPEGHVGRVWFTLKYDASTERLQVHIIKIKHLPSRTPALANACDPYIKIQLVPDERRVLQTKQKKKTCNPFYDETFVYQIPPNKLETLTLKLSVVDIGRVGTKKQVIGHIILPLSELDGIAADEEPQLYKLDIEKEIQEPVSDLGEMQVSLLYNENLHRLTVTVIEAKGLKLDPTPTKREVIARVTQERACRGVRARRTAAVEVSEEGSALISECFHFRLRADELHTTSVTVQALQPHSSYAKDRLLGKFVLGSYMFTRGRALQHWNSAISTPMEQVKQWHPLTN